MHVPWETFWHLNPKKLKPFEKAYEMEMDSRQRAANLNAWIQGMYEQHAIASIFGKNAKYPSKPFDLFSDAKPKTPEQEAEEFKEYVQQMAIKRKAVKALG